jgi:hypothetical protein
MSKFGKQLLVAWIFSISVIVFSNLAFAAPYWAEKPIQCASPKEVFARLDRDGLVPLFSSTGNARVENEIYTKMYAMLYNADNGKWAFIEFFDEQTTCVVVVGEGVDFNVMD